MLVNIIKLSSIYIAKMRLGAIGHPTATKNLAPATDSDMVTDEVLQPQFSGSQRSEKLHCSSKPYSFVMQPGGGNESLMVHEEKRDSDGIFAALIRKARTEAIYMKHQSFLPTYCHLHHTIKQKELNLDAKTSRIWRFYPISLLLVYR
ncbi:uncharacterized protein LOC111290416 [Durio zibethinus]|uniref:Uncharacterized protein LOC111290416 n=1 Tax=Durio zibethinus TaxID=66656 RepID=A0A6P5YBN6_DURZI|nr:uncharacterized protein LOC111290416 [Durio zibethinus]